MNFNNVHLVSALGAKLDVSAPPPSPTSKVALPPEPCLPARLPSTGFLEREAEDVAPRTLIRVRTRRSPSPAPSHEPESDESTGPPTPDTPVQERRERRQSITSIFSTASLSSLKSTLSAPKNGPSGVWKEPQPFEVFRAIEQKNLIYLMEIRDRAFPLLLRKTGDATPLLHAMRIGQTHRDVAIVLLGAFSRWINNLSDEDITKPKTKTILKALRVNLKLAIDFGLAKSQSDLTASFLQTLIMSEGEKWVGTQVENVARALRLGTAGQPVGIAGTIVRRFTTRELGKADLIATLEDYIANATSDLVVMGAWHLALEHVQSTEIPAYYFARDDRVYKAFTERLDANRALIHSKLGRRLKWQLRVLQVVLEGRATTNRCKVEILAGELDEGDGV